MGATVDKDAAAAAGEVRGVGNGAEDTPLFGAGRGANAVQRDVLASVAVDAVAQCMVQRDILKRNVTAVTEFDPRKNICPVVEGYDLPRAHGHLALQNRAVETHHVGRDLLRLAVEDVARMAVARAVGNGARSLVVDVHVAVDNARAPTLARETYVPLLDDVGILAAVDPEVYILRRHGHELPLTDIWAVPVGGEVAQRHILTILHVKDLHASVEDELRAAAVDHDIARTAQGHGYGLLAVGVGMEIIPSAREYDDGVVSAARLQSAGECPVRRRAAVGNGSVVRHTYAAHAYRTAGLLRRLLADRIIGTVIVSKVGRCGRGSDRLRGSDCGKRQRAHQGREVLHTGKDCHGT